MIDASPPLFVAPLLADLVGDAALAAHFSADAEIAAMLRFEKALADAQGACGMIPPAAARAIAGACDAFAPDLASLTAGAARDGVVVPDLVRQLRKAAGDAHGGQVHLGATSQDVIDTGLTLRLKDIASEIESRIRKLVDALAALATRDGGKNLMGHTRMQRARPITAAQKIDNWRAPLMRHLARFDEMRPRLFVLQLGGAVGDRAELGDKAQGVADHMAKALGLASAASARHAQRDAVVEFGQWLALVCGQLGKTGADIALMAQNEVAEIALASGGGSSAMPEKNNPVKAEILVALARQAATLAGGLHHALVHENERSGAAWTLEWLLLPPLVIATGAALRNAQALIDDLSFA
jgi:3-carboxy-cis,cis-muconate cycloisomerase